MKFYEIYKSESGYRVAAAIRNESPIISSSPWFATRAEAAEWRIKDIERRIAHLKEAVELGDYPPDVMSPVIEDFNRILDAAKYDVACV
jgi:hypothetical protein